MGCMTKNQIDLMRDRMDGPVDCVARKYARKVLWRTALPEDIIYMEMFLNANKVECHEYWALKMIYEDYQSRRREQDRQQSDPTSQEMDRRRWMKKSTAAKMGVFYSAVLRIIGRIRVRRASLL